MKLNNEEYLPISKCSKKYNIKATILHNWIKNKYVTYIVQGKTFYIKSSSITKMSESVANRELLLEEENQLKEQIKRAETMVKDMVTFSKPNVNEQAVNDAFYIFLDSMEKLIGPGGFILSSLVSGKSLVSLSIQSGKSLEELTANLKVAISRLRLYRFDVPILRKRLAQALVSNQSLILENKLLRAKLKSQTPMPDDKSERTNRNILQTYNEHLWELLSTPLASCPLSVRTINATRNGQLVTLFDFIMANKAGGMSGLLYKLNHFGKRSYKEIESLLIDKKLVTVLSSGQWVSPADCLIDKSNLIFIKYQKNVSHE